MPTGESTAQKFWACALPSAKSLEEENVSMWLVRSGILSYCRDVCSDEDGSCGTRLGGLFLFSPQWCAQMSPAPTPGPRSGCVLGLASKENKWISELMPERFSGGRRNGKKIESGDNYAKDM